MNTSLNQVSIWFLALAAILTSESSVAQSKRDGIELRLVAIEGGLPFSFSGRQPSTVNLEPLPLLRYTYLIVWPVKPCPTHSRYVCGPSSAIEPGCGSVAPLRGQGCL